MKLDVPVALMSEEQDMRFMSFEPLHPPSVIIRPGTEKRWAYKNVLGCGLSFLFVFTAFNGLQSLQSSINSEGSLGTATLSILYGLFVSVGFVSPSILRILGTKYSLLAGFVSHFFYTLANFYPSWYTLIPASVAVGAASPLIWAAGNSHLVEVALLVAPRIKVDQNHLIGTYTGLFFCIFSMGSVPSNLASSLILFPYENFTSNDSQTCDATGGRDFELKFLYILCSVYALSVVIGIVFAVLLISHLKPTISSFLSSNRKCKEFFKEPFLELLRVLKDIKMVLIAPISTFNGLEQAFAFGTFTAIISRCFGTYQVGFTLIVFGVTRAVSCAIYGKIVKFIPILCIFFFGGVINIALLLFLLLWTPSPSYLVIFLFAFLWGAADGVWSTMTACLTGFLFPTQSDTAYSALRIWQAFGFTLGFIIGLLNFEARVWVMIVAVIIALSCSIAIKVVTKFNVSSCYRRWSVTYARHEENDALAIEINTLATANHTPDAAAENTSATADHTPDAAAENTSATENHTFTAAENSELHSDCSSEDLCNSEQVKLLFTE